eukprot:6259294-Prymnesium_polylepis.1
MPVQECSPSLGRESSAQFERKAPGSARWRGGAAAAIARTPASPPRSQGGRANGRAAARCGATPAGRARAANTTADAAAAIRGGSAVP